MQKSQWAMVAGRMKEQYAREAKERQKTHGETAPGKTKNTGGKSTTSDSGKARDKAGEAAGVSAHRAAFCVSQQPSGDSSALAFAAEANRMPQTLQPMAAAMNNPPANPPRTPYWNEISPAASRSGGNTQQINGVSNLSTAESSWHEPINVHCSGKQSPQHNAATNPDVSGASVQR